jgi:uncharacterized membrane protein YjjP (DUF1212 family)
VAEVEWSAPALADAVDPAAEAFVLALVQALHRHGLPAYRIESAIARVGRRRQLELTVFTGPTGLTLGLGPLSAQRVVLLRVSPGSIYLARIAELAELIEEFGEGRLSLAAASARLGEIERTPPVHGPAVLVLAFALASAASAVFFGAPLGQVALSGAIGLVAGLIQREAARHERFAQLLGVLAAAAAALLAGLATLLPLALERDLVTLAAVIVLLPGYTLTVAMNELVAGHLSSGTARLGGVLATLFLLACGAAIGTAGADALLAALPPAMAATAPPQLLPAWAPWLALLLAPVAFKVLFQARDRDLAWIVGASVVAYLGARAGTHALGPLLGAGCGALALGIVSNALSRARLRPASITAVPGLLVLVPGSLGFRGVSTLFSADPAGLFGADAASGIELVTRMLAVAVSLVCGLLLATVLFPPQRTL